MRLAVEHTLELGRQRIALRPTLRAALRLDRRHGLRALVGGITDGSLSVMRDVLAESTDPRTFDPDLLLEIGPAGLGTTIEAVAAPLLGHVLDLYGIDPAEDYDDAEPAPVASGKPADPFAELFATATGVLGWSPEQAYAASPVEIIAARDGRLRFVGEILTAVFGGKTEGQLPDHPDAAQLDRGGLEDLRAMVR